MIAKNSSELMAVGRAPAQTATQNRDSRERCKAKRESQTTRTTILVAVELVDHCLELVVSQGLAKLARNSPHVLERDDASVVIIKQVERLRNLLVRVAGRDFLRH